MGLLSELTYTHLEVMSAVDEIESRIVRARHHRHDREDARELLVGVVPWVIGLRSVLLDYFEHERDQLFPRVQRVFGADMEEIFLLEKYHRLIIDALDDFLTELPDPDDEPRSTVKAVHMAYLELLFDDFRDLYERHCVVERKFYETYSTIIFPGGAVAD